LRRDLLSRSPDIGGLLILDTFFPLKHFGFVCWRRFFKVNVVRVRHLHEIESADLETENNNKPLRIEEEEPVTTLSPATSSTSLYASEKFYSDAESDDEYKDPLPDVYPQSKSFHSVIP
jgi:hypothetical protein